MEKQMIMYVLLLLQGLTGKNMDFRVRETHIRNPIPTLTTCIKVSSDLTSLSMFPFLSHVAVCVYFRRWLFVRQCRPLDSHLDLSPSFTVVVIIWKPFTDHYFSNPALCKGWTLDTIRLVCCQYAQASILHPEFSVRTSLLHICCKVLFPLYSLACPPLSNEDSTWYQNSIRIQKETKQKLKRKCCQRKWKYRSP